MKLCGIVTLLLLASGCAMTRIVNLDTGQGAPIVYKPADTDPIEIEEADFRNAVARLVLDMDLKVGLDASRQDDRLALLASNGDGIGDARGRTVPSSYERLCQEQSDPKGCLSLLSGRFELDRTERRTVALYFAFDTVWSGVEDAMRDLMNPSALRAMVVSIAGTMFVMLVAPEPITKFIAIGLTVSLIAYLGAGPVWNLGQGFRQLVKESENARSISELEDTGHRFGRVLGDNGARVLVMVLLTAIGGKNAMAEQGPGLPGAVQAALRAQTEGGFQLSAALAGQVSSISIPAAGELNVALAPTAVAAVAMGPGSSMQGDPEGEIHHICTDKNEVSEASGGPWTPRFEDFFKRAGMGLDDPANKVRIKGHKGPHPREYHKEVLDRIAKAMAKCRGQAECRAALVNELDAIARELTTEGALLRKLIIKGQKD